MQAARTLFDLVSRLRIQHILFPYCLHVFMLCYLGIGVAFSLQINFVVFLLYIQFIVESLIVVISG